MTTRSGRRQTAAPRGGRTGGWTGRGGGRTRERTSRVGGRTGDRDGQGDNQGVGENVGIDEVPDFSTVIAQLLQDLLLTIIAQAGGLDHVNHVIRFSLEYGISKCTSIGSSFPSHTRSYGIQEEKKMKKEEEVIERE
nr:hypothetical protein [Tanacetum cinerariifolium]